jgi:hypothetical protein
MVGRQQALLFKAQQLLGDFYRLAVFASLTKPHPLIVESCHPAADGETAVVKGLGLGRAAHLLVQLS